MKRTLTLKREALTELATDDLALVNGAQAPSVFCTSALTFCDPVCALTTEVAVNGNTTTLIATVLCPTTR
jgi:hypothetical protein